MQGLKYQKHPIVQIWVLLTAWAVSFAPLVPEKFLIIIYSSWQPGSYSGS